jgi:hypothetical protein
MDWLYAHGNHYTVDDVNRVTNLDLGNATTYFQHNHYQYDSVGRETATWHDEDGKGEWFRYTPSSQVKEARYDAQQVWTDNPANAVLSESFVYKPDTLNRSNLGKGRGS